MRRLILLSLIKKEVVQFFRSKSDVVTMLVFPIILILVMGKSLDNLMSKETNIFRDKIIYYRVNNLDYNDNIKRFYDFITEFEKETNVKFIEINSYEDATRSVNNNESICFIDIYDDNIDYFRNEKKESTESKIFRNLYEQYMRKILFIQSTIKSNPEQIQKLLRTNDKINIIEESISESEVDSFTYYTFAELILIISYISTLTSISMYKERDLHTMTRLKLSKANKSKIFISKIFLGIIVGLLQISVIYFISKKFFNVNWGNNLLYMLMVLISFIIFSSVLGIFISMIFSDQKTAYIFNNILIIIMGFLGGAYFPLCLIRSSRITSFLCTIVPTYWSNISLLSLNYNLQTKYYIISISLSLGLSIAMLILGNIISKLKAGGSFD